MEQPSFAQCFGALECMGQQGWLGSATVSAAAQRKAALQAISANSATAKAARFRICSRNSTRAFHDAREQPVLKPLISMGSIAWAGANGSVFAHELSRLPRAGGGSSPVR